LPSLPVDAAEELTSRTRSDLAGEPSPGGLTVSTFHELCLTLGREAGTLPPEPADKTQEWWDEILPRALYDALSVVGGRYHAIVVDEGQDFARDWLDSLYLMLTDAEHDVLYVFHDPEQALYRDDAVASLGLAEYVVSNRRARRNAVEKCGRLSERSATPVPGHGPSGIGNLSATRRCAYARSRLFGLPLF
jgi:superfamily I DNA/RNA helicase